MLRAPNLADAPALAAIGRETFVETFGHLYRPEDLNAFVDATYATKAVARDIADPQRILRVAEVDGAMAGYCKLGTSVSFTDYDIVDRHGMELKQLYVRAAFQGTGIAVALMDWAMAEMRARGAEVIVLSVWSENVRAQRFYERYGFRKVADTYFMVGNHRDDEYLFACDLTVAT